MLTGVALQTLNTLTTGLLVAFLPARYLLRESSFTFVQACFHQCLLVLDKQSSLSRLQEAQGVDRFAWVDAFCDAGNELASSYPSFMRADPGEPQEDSSAAMLDSRREPRVSAWLHKLLRKKNHVQRGHD